MTNIKVKDTVVVLCGKDKGKRGEVRRIISGKDKVVVGGVNMVVKHARAAQNKPGGIQKKEAAMHLSKVALICPKCSKTMRPKFETLNSGEKIRVCRKCGGQIV